MGSRKKVAAEGRKMIAKAKREERTALAIAKKSTRRMLDQVQAIPLIKEHDPYQEQHVPGKEDI